jgi:hypothetical protein
MTPEETHGTTEPEMKEHAAAHSATGVTQSLAIRSKHRLRALFRILFGLRRRGFDVPIIASILFTIFPLALVYQQNRLIADQGRISDEQRKIMNTQAEIARDQIKLTSLQALAEQANSSRQLRLALNGVTGVITDLGAVMSSYRDIQNMSVRVQGHVMKSEIPQTFSIDETFPDFNPGLCGDHYAKLFPALRCFMWVARVPAFRQ